MLSAADKKLKGRYCWFKVRDIHLPEPNEVLHELHDAQELRGKVVDFSDSGRAHGSAFALVKVRQLRRPCIVAVDRLITRKRRSRKR